VADPPLQVVPVAPGRSGRAAGVAAGVVALGLVTVILVGRFGGQVFGSQPASTAAAPIAGASPSLPVQRPPPSAPTPSRVPVSAASATPAPLPSRLVPFRVLASSGAPLTYVSPNLGFAVPLLLELPPSGYWDEGGPASDAGGTLTFSVPAETSALAAGEICVVVGSERDPAPVRIPADVGRVVPLWAPNLVTLVAQYGLLLDGAFGAQTPITLGGEQAHLFEHPRGAAAVVVAVHGGRV
jgi:hypothetical protein